MKKILFLLIALIGFKFTNAQFANTSWKGLYKVPDPTEMILQFKTDTLLLNDPENETVVETMNYSISGDTLVFTKLNGSSSCGEEKGVYKLAIKDNKLFMTVIDDPCYDRVAAMPDEALMKVED